MQQYKIQQNHMEGRTERQTDSQVAETQPKIN